jgi:Nuclease-related domain
VTDEERSAAGASARREYERRRARDDAHLRARWGRLGGVAVALSRERPSTAAWATGAEGEEMLGRRLESLVSPQLALLHDRRIPGSRANIDHLVVTTAGIWVIDPKRYRDQRPRLRSQGGVLRPRSTKLVVGRRDCSKLVEGVLWQMERVRQVVPTLPITGVLCFVEADWPIIGGAFSIRGVRVLWPRRLVRLLGQEAGEIDVAATVRKLAGRFPPA